MTVTEIQHTPRTRAAMICQPAINAGREVPSEAQHVKVRDLAMFEREFPTLRAIGFAKLNFLYDVKKWSPRSQKMAMFGVNVKLQSTAIRRCCDAPW